MEDCPLLEALDPYRIDCPSNALFNTAFKEGRGDIRKRPFPNQVS